MIVCVRRGQQHVKTFTQVCEGDRLVSLVNHSTNVHAMNSPQFHNVPQMPRAYHEASRIGLCKTLSVHRGEASRMRLSSLHRDASRKVACVGRYLGTRPG